MQTLKVGKYIIEYPNRKEVLGLKNEIFIDEIYKFSTTNEQPLIIDAGAYIGLSTLYFKREYPNAKIIAIEPNPKAIAYLERNITNNNIKNIEIIEKALSGEKGERDFYIDTNDREWNSTAGFNEGTWLGTQESEKITIETILLSDILNKYETVDLLKIDIEGAEKVVLNESEDFLKRVKHILVEYHPIKNNKLDVLTKLLRRSGFDLTFWNEGDGTDLVLIEGKRLSLK